MVLRGRDRLGVSVLAAFVMLELTLCLIPGPAVLLTVSTSLRRGFRGGALAASGILAGNTVYFVLSGLGLIALVMASHSAFTVVKYAGAAYLGYIGLRALLARTPPMPHGELETHRIRSSGRAFASGFVTQMANPKAMIFFAAILPQFVDMHGSVPLQIGILTLASVVAELAVLSCYAAAADRLRRTQLASRASLWIERAGGAVLIGIAARLAREPLVSAP